MFLDRERVTRQLQPLGSHNACIFTTIAEMIHATLSDNPATALLDIGTTFPAFAIQFAYARRMSVEAIESSKIPEKSRAQAQEILDLMTRIVALVDAPDPSPPEPQGIEDILRGVGIDLEENQTLGEALDDARERPWVGEGIHIGTGEARE